MAVSATVNASIRAYGEIHLLIDPVTTADLEMNGDATDNSVNSISRTWVNKVNNVNIPGINVLILMNMKHYITRDLTIRREKFKSFIR